MRRVRGIYAMCEIVILYIVVTISSSLTNYLPVVATRYSIIIITLVAACGIIHTNIGSTNLQTAFLEQLTVL